MVLHLLRYVSFLMVLAFGLNISAEALANSDSLVCRDSLQISSVSKISHSYLNSDVSSSRQSKDHSPCDDPCHFGQCHFGHCSFIHFGTSFDVRKLEQPADLIVTNQFMIEGPVLEGPRRPPRQV